MWKIDNALRSPTSLPITSHRVIANPPKGTRGLTRKRLEQESPASYVKSATPSNNRPAPRSAPHNPEASPADAFPETWNQFVLTFT